MNHSTPSQYRPGDVVKGRFAVLGVCGMGGMGNIYRVRDTAMDNRTAALKVFPPNLLLEDSTARERFRREAVIAAGLKHPNIVEVYDFTLETTGPLLIAMEFVEGMSLLERITNAEAGKLSVPQIVRILKAIASGLAYAHDQAVVHRDLKPANVLLGDGGIVKIADFGLCDSDVFDEGLTQTGECVGTPYYMAPEQITAGHADNRSDIYSFGILAYEVLTGSVPFKGGTWFEIAEKHLNEELPPLPEGAPEWFEELLEVCTAKEPEDRFETGAELLAWLEAATDESRPFVSRRAEATGSYRKASAIGLVFCVVLLSVLGVAALSFFFKSSSAGDGVIQPLPAEHPRIAAPPFDR